MSSRRPPTSVSSRCCGRSFTTTRRSGKVLSMSKSKKDKGKIKPHTKDAWNLARVAAPIFVSVAAIRDDNGELVHEDPEAMRLSVHLAHKLFDASWAHLVDEFDAQEAVERGG
jgi:hypothetical protein